MPISNPNLERCFVLACDGRPISSHTFNEPDGYTVHLFVCQVCMGLTGQPEWHANWHAREEQALEATLSELWATLHDAGIYNPNEEE